MLRSFPLPRNHTISSQSGSQSLLCLSLDSDSQQISILPHSNSKTTATEKSKPIWTVSKPIDNAPSNPRHVTAVLPLNLGSIIVGYGKTGFHMSFCDCSASSILDDGHLNKLSLDELVFTRRDESDKENSANNCAILSLFAIQNLRTRRRLIVGGGDDGSINVWDLE